MLFIKKDSVNIMFFFFVKDEITVLSFIFGLTIKKSTNKFVKVNFIMEIIV